MAIHYTVTVNGDTLVVTASGFDENAAEVQEYGLAIIRACLQGDVVKVLCNELDLEYRLGTVDTYQAAAFISAHAPRVGQVAIVSNPKYTEDALFPEDVAVNRGLTVRVFKSVDAATRWLRHPVARSAS